ncbi:hypothetical protein M430DRAFT_137917 [Amorphotheca resinae ATCC 22711]|uniref:Calmodulin n=1 Tax=Amorphotheca resinae ATCC 22711 TaxID=857342 RepID=A0A2T3B734_AMORE|nr:hypothetical protein M430DRAFT_137917 [Amorphotheca resinae ATCC 22711]PSS22552.1 hypothetical protein M430DRAFT_137917 [Amorphotheca resinae ATCC 22711]
MARTLSAEEIQILREEFNQYDIDKAGSITVEEFGKVMKASGHNATDAEIAQIIKDVDLNGDGTINFNEFIAMMTGRIKPAAAVDTEADYRAAWKEFDPSFNGSITASQLRQIMAGLGEVATDVEVDGLMNSVDGDQKISYREFVEFAKRKSGDV